jgi:uncharacterized protein with HEPN domain
VIRKHSLFVNDIVAAIDAIEEFVKGMEMKDLENDDKTASAVIRKLEIIGEAAKHVHDSVRARYPKIPWQKMAGMRDRLIHAYFGIDYALVWDVIKKELHGVKNGLKKVAGELEKEEKSAG